MNAARAMGNSGDPVYVDALAEACLPNRDARVAAMAAWALGRIGGQRARAVLEGRRPLASGVLEQEIDAALSRE